MNPDVSKLMKEAQKMQERMKDAQKELENLVVVGVSGAGLVEIKMTGRHDVNEVSLDDDVLDDEKSVIEDLIAAAVNDAVRKVESETRGKMSTLTAGLDLPKDLSGSGES